MLTDEGRQHLYRVVEEQRRLGARRQPRINALCQGLADMVTFKAMQEGIAPTAGQMLCEGFMLGLGLTRYTPEAAAELAMFFEGQGTIDPGLAEIVAAVLYPDEEEGESNG